MCSVVLPKTDKMFNVENQVDNCNPEEEQKATKRKLSLSNCGVCESEEAKYKCPACLAHTCSLVCVKKHKSDSGCSGIRNKTAFVTLSHFDEMNLLSDYRFLEDTGRFADGATRDNLIRTPRYSFKAKKLAIFARKMNITLRFLPVTFTKSKENSTFFLRAKKLFLWHLKLIFPQSSTEFSQRRVSDDQSLIQILSAYIHPTESDPVKRQKLKMYVHHPFTHVKVFMKAEGRKANSVRYHELDIEKSLRENLSYKTLIEYPVLHVVLRDYWKDFPLKGPAEPASACSNSATRNVWMDQEKEKEEEGMEMEKEAKTKEKEEEKTKEGDKEEEGMEMEEKAEEEKTKVEEEEEVEKKKEEVGMEMEKEAKTKAGEEEKTNEGDKEEEGMEMEKTEEEEKVEEKKEEVGMDMVKKVKEKEEEEKTKEEEKVEEKKEEVGMDLAKKKKEENENVVEEEKTKEEKKRKEDKVEEVGMDLVEKTKKEDKVVEEKKKAKEEEKEATKDIRHIQGSCTPEGTNICTRVQETTPETEPPLEKRARRGVEEDEREEGEIVDSSDEEDRMQSQ